MRLQILSVPGCPHTSLLDGRLAEAMASLGLNLAVEQVTVADEDHARASGMNGSPTLLLDGAPAVAAIAKSLAEA